MKRHEQATIQVKYEMIKQQFKQTNNQACKETKHNKLLHQFLPLFDIHQKENREQNVCDCSTKITVCRLKKLFFINQHKNYILDQVFILLEALGLSDEVVTGVALTGCDGDVGLTGVATISSWFTSSFSVSLPS